MSYPFLSLGFNSWTQKFSRGDVIQALLEYVTTTVSSFTLRSTGSVNYTVDWGDGTVETLTTTAPTHNYSSAGSYTIKITPAEGSIYRPYFNNAVSDTSIASVSGSGGSQLGTDLLDAWEGATNMTSFSGDIDTSSVTIFYQAWRSCSKLTSFPLIDTSSGTNFQGAWRDCSSLTSFPQLDTSSCTGTGFSYAWYNCSKLTSFPLIDTSSGTNFQWAWYNCRLLTSFPLIDTSNATNFYSAWNNCTYLTSFPQLDTSNVTYFGPTWYRCENLTTFPVLNYSSISSNESFNFDNTWLDCKLSPQSIENILVPLDNTGTVNNRLRLENVNLGNNAGYYTWTAAAQTALANLQAKGWTISYNP